MISDVDVESEKFRFLGGNRFYLKTPQILSKAKAYRGTVSYIPASKTIKESDLPKTVDEEITDKK